MSGSRRYNNTLQRMSRFISSETSQKWKIKEKSNSIGQLSSPKITASTKSSKLLPRQEIMSRMYFPVREKSSSIKPKKKTRRPKRLRIIRVQHQAEVIIRKPSSKRAGLADQRKREVKRVAADISPTFYLNI